MKVKSFFAVLGIFACLFVVGCTNETSVDNSTGVVPDSTIGIAKAGGVKVGCQLTCDAIKEDNVLAPYSTGYIWIARGSKGLPSGSYSCQICTTGTNTTGQNPSCSSLSCTFDFQCSDPNYFISPFTVPSSEGVYTVTVNVSGKNLGADTFTVDSDSGECF